MTKPPTAATFCRVLPLPEQATALGESFGHLAHDFNNLLAAISGSASLIEMAGDQSLETQRHLRNIQTASNRGARIMHQLLMLSPRTDEPLSLCTVEDLLKDAKASAEAVFGPAYTLTFFAAEGLPPLVADSRQVRLALSAVIENACDSMPQGGVVVVSACVRTVSEIEAEAARVGAGDFLALTVQDTGPGVAATAAERIGEPFFTTKRNGKGAGLGLALANRAARRHGGFVIVDSEAGSGTRVTCHFRLGLTAGS